MKVSQTNALDVPAQKDVFDRTTVHLTIYLLAVILRFCRESATTADPNWAADCTSTGGRTFLTPWLLTTTTYFQNAFFAPYILDEHQQRMLHIPVDQSFVKLASKVASEILALAL